MGGVNNAVEHLKFVKNNHRIAGRIAKGFFKKIVMRKPVLRTIDWAMLYECNFSCPFCSAYHLKNSGKRYLTVDEIKDVWQQAMKLGAIHVNITGGEPMLINEERLLQIIKNFQPERTIISLVSNGFLLTQERVTRLKEAGLNTLQISLESAVEEEHDTARNVKGSYKKIMEGVGYAKNVGLNVCLSVVVTHNNIDKIPELVKLTKKLGTFLLLNPLSTYGKGESGNRLTQEDLVKYNNLLKTKHVRADTIFNFNGRSGCPGGTERIHITSYGDVITCPLVQISYGNVLEEPLEKIWKKMGSFEHIKTFKPYCKQAFWEEYYKDFCEPLANKPNMPIPIEEFKNAKKTDEDGK